MMDIYLSLLFFSVSRREINEPRGVCPAGIYQAGRSGAAAESFGSNMAANLVSLSRVLYIFISLQLMAPFTLGLFFCV